MSRSTSDGITDILRAIDRCQRFVDALGSDDIDLADMAEDAIEHNLQTIGEAAKHLPAEITDAHPDIAWPQIRGFRNILVHQYFGVDAGTVRDVVDSYLPLLADALRPYEQ